MDKTDDQIEGKAVRKNLIAKKDWRILCGAFNKEKNTHEHDFQIKAGDDVSKLPKWALVTLKTENVI